mmetsp:Transcript_92815/g.259399  ORF Transcript_92815/g.259399 Transcript_92815/m.259399 type:complete len:209 (+) Transcript_92815:520-1146(+)
MVEAQEQGLLREPPHDEGVHARGDRRAAVSHAVGVLQAVVALALQHGVCADDFGEQHVHLDRRRLQLGCDVYGHRVALRVGRQHLYHLLHGGGVAPRLGLQAPQILRRGLVACLRHRARAADDPRNMGVSVRSFPDFRRKRRWRAEQIHDPACPAPSETIARHASVQGLPAALRVGEGYGPSHAIALVYAPASLRARLCLRRRAQELL